MDIRKENLDLYIKEMAHYDPDNMEMGARAVSQLVITGALELQLNQQVATKIRQAFIKQMQSQNYNVHAHAIKCVADMISRLPSNQVRIIFEKTIKSISDPDLDQKKREIYGVCAGTMIHQAHDDFGRVLVQLFTDSVQAILQTKQQKISIQTMLINVISEFIRKWPNVAGSKNTVFNRKKLIEYLMNNIQNRNNYELIRKSQSAIGKLALIMNNQDFVAIMSDKNLGLLSYFRRNIGKFDHVSLKALREAVSSLTYVLKTHNSELKHWAIELTNLLLQIVDKYSKNAQVSEIDIFCDIIEGALTCEAYIIKSFSRQLQNLYSDPSQPITNFIIVLTNFDVEGMMSYLTAQTEMQGDFQGHQENYDYYDNDNEMDQKCWKVRRATLHYINFLIKKDKFFRQKTVKSDNFIKILGNKLTQENYSVSQSAIQVFNSILQAITDKNVKEDRVQEVGLMKVKSNEVNFVFMILDQIHKNTEIVFKSAKANQQVKGALAKLILKVIYFTKNDFSLQNHALFSRIQTLSQAQFARTTVVENKFTHLIILRQIVNACFGFNAYEKTLNIFMNMSSHSNFKIVSAAYKGIFKMLLEFNDKIVSHDIFQQILKNISGKLKQHDIDKTIKKSVMKCAGSIFEFTFDKLKQFRQNQLLEALNQKLKIQIQKGYILRQLVRIRPGYVAKQSQFSIFNQIMHKTIENLGSNNFDLNSQAIALTKKLIQILDQNLDKKTVIEILNKSKPLLIDSNIPSYINQLMQRFPNEFTQYAQILIKTADIQIIENLISYKIADQKMCISILKNNAKPEKAKKISKILSKLGVSDKQLMRDSDDSLWGRISLGALGYVGNQNNYAFLSKLIKEGKSEDVKFEACSALGNIAAHDQNNISQMLMSQADRSTDCYLYIYTIREMLSFSQKEFSAIQKLTDWLLKKCQQSFDGQSVYYVISQCIGKIAILSSNVLDQLLKFAGKMSQNQRYTFSNSLRFAFEDRTNLMDCLQYQNYIKVIVEFAKDSSVQVRHGAMKSLASIVGNHSQLLKNSINQQFWNILKKNLLIDQSLIIEVDYGITKEKKDTGKPLRLQSFNFLKFAIAKFNFEHHIHDFMQICLQKIDKQNSTDLVIKRVNIIKMLCEKDFSSFISLQNEFKNKLGMQNGVLKGYISANQTGDERTQVFLKGLFKQILQISKIGEKEDSDQIKGFISHLKGNQRFIEIIASLQQTANKMI